MTGNARSAKRDRNRQRDYHRALVGGTLPMLEHRFGITTDISWLEASDLNHPLLRRMTIEAPGTYHHSLVEANLAGAAAERLVQRAALPRLRVFPRRRQTREAGIFH